MTDTKHRLTAATSATLRSAGIAGLSARAIATTADVNQALIFYHFGTVADLVVAAAKETVDASVAQYRDDFASVVSLTQLLSLGRALHEREREAGNVQLMAQLMAGAQHDDRLAEAARYAMRTWSAEIEAVVRRVLAPSPLALIADPVGLSRAISGAFIGLELYDGVDPDAATNALDALEQLGVLVEVMDDLGPVARRALQSRVKRTSKAPKKLAEKAAKKTKKKGSGKSDTTV